MSTTSSFGLKSHPDVFSALQGSKSESNLQRCLRKFHDMCGQSSNKFRGFYYEVGLVIDEHPRPGVLTEGTRAIHIEYYIALEFLENPTRTAGVDTVSEEAVARPCMRGQQIESF